MADVVLMDWPTSLIAAAPDLLEALQDLDDEADEMRAFVEETERDPFEMDLDRSRELVAILRRCSERARAAIAKAAGEEA